MAIGDLVVNLIARTRQFTSPLGGALNSLRSFVSNASTMMAGIGVASVVGLAAAGVAAVKMAADAEQVGISYEVMLGSADKAKSLLTQMRQFAGTTPLDTASLQQSGQTLLQFGVAGGQVMPILRMLGDVSGGNAEKLKGLAVVYGQMSASGRLMGQDLLQFINQGFNPLQEISEHTGESMASLKQKMEAGGISAAMVAASFQRATSEGGQFYGMLQRQGQSTSGLFGQLQDAVSLAMVDIGNAILTGFDLKGLLGDVNGFLDEFRSTWMPGIVATINLVGQSFQRLLQMLRGEWGAWISGSLAGIVDFVANFDIYFQVAQQNVVLFASNALNWISNFFTNIGELLSWFGKNWSDVFFTAADYVLTIFINLGQNLRNIWGAVLDYIAGNGFQVDLAPLTEGFRSSISQMPQFTEAAIADTTPELERLYGELAQRYQNAAGAAAALPVQDAIATAEEALKLGTDQSTATKKKTKGKEQFAAALTRGSSEAISALNKAAYGREQSPTKKLESQGAQQVKLQEEMVSLLRQQADAPSDEEPTADFGWA